MLLHLDFTHTCRLAAHQSSQQKNVVDTSVFPRSRDSDLFKDVIDSRGLGWYGLENEHNSHFEQISVFSLQL
jgi:hypothetical protein